MPEKFKTMKSKITIKSNDIDSMHIIWRQLYGFGFDVQKPIKVKWSWLKFNSYFELVLKKL